MNPPSSPQNEFTTHPPSYGGYSAPPHSPPPKPSRIVPLLASLICVILGGGTTVIQITLARQSASTELENGFSFMKHAVSEEQAWLESIGKRLAGDARIRSTLGISEIDEKTITDILNDLRSADKLTLLGALDDQGRVRAVVGADSLRGTNLSSSKVVQAVLTKNEPSRGIWALVDRAVSIVVLPVNVGLGKKAYLILGHELEATLLDVLTRSGRNQAAILVGGSVVAKSSNAGNDDIFTKVLSTQSAPSGFVHRVDALSEGGAPVQLVWLYDTSSDAWALSLSRWAPLIVGLIAAGVLWLMTRRR